MPSPGDTGASISDVAVLEAAFYAHTTAWHRCKQAGTCPARQVLKDALDKMRALAEQQDTGAKDQKDTLSSRFVMEPGEIVWEDE